MSELGDVISASGGFFAHIKNYNLGVDNMVLDMLLIERYSTRQLSPMIEKYVENGVISSDNLDKIGEMITAKFSDLWDSVKVVNGVSIDFTSPYSITRTKENTVSKEGSSKNEHSENEKLYAFDDESGSNTVSHDSTDSGNSTDSEKGNETETTTGHRKEVDISNMLSYIDLHSRKNIVSTYLDSVGSVLTVPVWGE